MMLNHGDVVDEDMLYEQLWKICAGPLVDVPHVGQRVIYFPQGHMEQLEASINQRIPLFNLPTKILCRVINVHLLQAEPTIPDPCTAEVLTASDTNTHGGFSVLRKHATECLLLKSSIEEEEDGSVCHTEEDGVVNSVK